MSPSTITLLFLAFAIVSFILEKIPLGLTATIVAIGLNLTGVLSNSDTFAPATSPRCSRARCGCSSALPSRR